MTPLKPFDDLYAVPPGQVPEGYKELFTTESATEQDWAGVVEDIADWSDNIPKLFYNYNACGRDFRDIIESAFKTATASGHSLLAANGLEGNYAIVKRCEMGCPA